MRSFQGVGPTPRVWLGIHAGLTGVWILLVIPTLIWWRDSIFWVAFMSLWANAASHAAAALAARAAAEQVATSHRRRPHLEPTIAPSRRLRQ